MQTLKQIINIQQCPAHLNQLAEWHFAEWSYLHPEMTLEQLLHNMQQYFTDDFLPSLFVAVEQGQLLGSSSIVADDLAQRPDLSPWLANVYVHAAQRGKGLGQQLVQHAIQQAQQAGFDALYLFTADQQAFYSNMGWQVVDTTSVEGTLQTIMRYTFTP
jgi:GNAT superfamily N-acetyltransferase